MVISHAPPHILLPEFYVEISGLFLKIPNTNKNITPQCHYDTPYVVKSNYHGISVIVQSEIHCKAVFTPSISVDAFESYQNPFEF